MVATKDNLTNYHIYRTRVVDEHGFINHRLMWMVLSEAALFSAALLLYKEKGGVVFVFAILVVLAGIAVAVVSFLSVKAAHDEMKFLVDRYADHFGNSTDASDFLPLTGSGNRHWLGHLLPSLLPLIIIGLWMIIGSVFVASRYEIKFTWTDIRSEQALSSGQQAPAQIGS